MSDAPCVIFGATRYFQGQLEIQALVCGVPVIVFESTIWDSFWGRHGGEGTFWQVLMRDPREEPNELARVLARRLAEQRT